MFKKSLSFAKDWIKPIRQARYIRKGKILGLYRDELAQAYIRPLAKVFYDIIKGFAF
jgi:hypothetical protein